jgi:HAD superfamily hydrolase (TIGR01662 family)
VTEFDAILFDAGGVLVLPDPTVLGPLLAHYGGTDDLDTHLRAHYSAMAAKSRAAADETDWHSYNEAYVQMVGVDELYAALAELVLSRTRNAYLWRYPVPDSVEALRRLYEAGVPIGVVSNASGQIEQTLMVAGVCQVGEGPHVPVRVIVDSHVVGVSKPDPAIFDHALPAFEGIDRHRIAYVGDSVTMDVGGATAAGLVPILVDPYDDHAGAPFRRIRSLLDLL